MSLSQKDVIVFQSVPSGAPFPTVSDAKRFANRPEMIIMSKITFGKGGGSMADLNTDVRYIKGVGEAKAKALGKLGIATLGDLIG